jgi:hypothetical protein
MVAIRSDLIEEIDITRRLIGSLVTLAVSLLMVPLAATAPPLKKMPRIRRLALGRPPASPEWKGRSLFAQEPRKLG